MKIRIVLGAVAIVMLAAACGGSSAPAASQGTASTTTPAASASCHQQYETWKHGPANAIAKKLEASLRDVERAGNAEDLTLLTSSLKKTGATARKLKAHPIPHCADPHGYWAKILDRIRTAGDNATSGGGGLSSLLLALAPLKSVPALEGKLAAELKKTAGVTQTHI
ncbi:MAG: hypothetical protein ABJB47_04775 [Actinomycetota bacterium]